MMTENKASYNVCVAKVYQDKPVRRVFTQVGVGFVSGDSVRMKLDLTIILGPDDELYLFPKEKAGQ